jgi:DNA-binding NarL/FixJ family response regulator
MRVYWERTGVLGPIYRLVSQGFNDREIAKTLNLSDIKVHDCISWMLQAFRLPDRMELARDAFGADHPLNWHS